MSCLDKALGLSNSYQKLSHLEKNPLICFPALEQMEPERRSPGPGTGKFINHHIFLCQPPILFRYPSHRRLMGIVYLGS